MPANLLSAGSRRAVAWLLTAVAMALPAGAQEGGVDATIQPGDDFFAYANGDWLKATEIPAGKGRWGAFNDIAEATRQQVAGAIAQAATRPPGSSARKLADFHAAYLDVATVEAKGTAPIQAPLQRIAALRDKRALARWLGAGLRADVDPLNLGVFASQSHPFGLAVQYGIHGEHNHFAYLLQGGLGLPTREHYLATSDAMQALRGRYQIYIAEQLARAGFDRAAERAQAVLALETAIARSHATPEVSGNERNADQHWTRADFARQAPGLDWPVFFAAAGLARQQDIVAWQPTAITGVAALVASQPLAAWQDYGRFHLIDHYADVLPRAFADAALAMRTAAGVPLPAARAERATAALQRAMPDALGRLYVEQHFPPPAKARLQAIVAQVTAAFDQRIAASSWMTPSSQAMARAKLKSMYFGVGHPDAWPDDRGLVIDARDAVGNQRRAAEWRYRAELAKLGRPVDQREWVIAAQWPGAVLNFLRNAYNFSAALLQVPKFDAQASDAANFGAIGAIVGHEICHFVDTLGADYDAQGALRPWWTAEDKARYAAASQALVDQFSAYRPFPDVAVNGELGKVENIADLAGLSAAFDAYRRALGDKAGDKDFVRQQDRQFFIGFARAWRSKLRDDAMRTQAASNDHAPETYRVATVRNLDAWYEAFDVRPGQRLYLAPAERVRIW